MYSFDACGWQEPRPSQTRLGLGFDYRAYWQCYRAYRQTTTGAATRLLVDENKPEDSLFIKNNILLFNLIIPMPCNGDDSTGWLTNT